MSWAAVIGSPINHSLSPILHTAAWRSIGAPTSWIYRRDEVTCEQLGDYLRSCADQMLGLSVTMPLKQAILTYLDVVEPQAQAIGAVNTVIESAGVLTGFNTDLHGIVTAIVEGREQAGLPIARPTPSSAKVLGHSKALNGQRAVILGGRATACTALAALGSLGISDISVVARNFGGTGSILTAAHRLGVEVEQIPLQATPQVIHALNDADIVISTVPADAHDSYLSGVCPRAEATVLDVVYSPWQTPLLSHWKDCGAHTIHGTEMLIHQAAMQVQLMTGREPDPYQMREALHGAIKEQA